MKRIKRTIIDKCSLIPRSISVALLFCFVLTAFAGCSKTDPTEAEEINITESVCVITEPSETAGPEVSMIYSDEQEYLETIPTADETTQPTAEKTIEDIFEEEIEKVPSYQLELLRYKGWSIELTNMDLAAEYGYSSPICGITLYNESIIYIKSSEYAIKRATIHEIGHAIAYELGWPEEEDAFVAIFEQEKYRFTDMYSIGDGHEISDKYEYFASVYQNMILDYYRTRLEVPQTVAYIEACCAGIRIIEETE